MMGTSFAGSDVTRRLILLEANRVLSPCQSPRQSHWQEDRGNKVVSILNPDEKELDGYCVTSRNREKK